MPLAASTRCAKNDFASSGPVPFGRVGIALLLRDDPLEIEPLRRPGTLRCAGSFAEPVGY